MLNIAVIGAGRIGHNQARTIAGSKRAWLVGGTAPAAPANADLAATTGTSVWAAPEGALR